MHGGSSIRRSGQLETSAERNSVLKLDFYVRYHLLFSCLTVKDVVEAYLGFVIQNTEYNDDTKNCRQFKRMSKKELRIFYIIFSRKL